MLRNTGRSKMVHCRKGVISFMWVHRIVEKKTQIDIDFMPKGEIMYID